MEIQTEPVLTRGSSNNGGEGEQQEKKKKRAFLWIWLGAFLLITALLILFILKPWSNEQVYVGLRKGMPTNKKGLEKFIKEGQANVLLNPNPVFENGDSVGTISIANQPANRRDMQVNIYLIGEDSKKGVLIYESPIIAPDHYIDGAKLLVPLNKGLYRAVAKVDFYFEGEKTTLNSEFEIMIQVLN